MDACKEEGLSSSYYTILGVSLDSSVDEIRRAYRKLAMVSFLFFHLRACFLFWICVYCMQNVCENAAVKLLV